MYEKESVVRGHHVYKAIWTPVIGEELEVRTVGLEVPCMYVYSSCASLNSFSAKSTALSLNVTSYALRALLTPAVAMV